MQNPTYPTPPVIISGTTGTAPIGYSVDSHFHAAIDMQAAIGIDRQLSKVMTANVTYLYSRGVHTYFTDNATAVGNFPEVNVQTNTYQDSSVKESTENNMQYESGGVYRQNQIIASLTARYSRFSIFSYYTYNNARADSSGVNYTPSIATPI